MPDLHRGPLTTFRVNRPRIQDKSAQKNLLVESRIVLKLDDPDKPRAATWLQETNL